MLKTKTSYKKMVDHFVAQKPLQKQAGIEGQPKLKKIDKKDHTAHFLKSKTFDYSQLLSANGIMTLDSYFDLDLVSFIDSITTHSNKHDYHCIYQDL